MKNPVTFRLSDTTHKGLKSISKSWGISIPDVIAILAHAVQTGLIDDIDEITAMIDLARKL
jgi:hypothetical protein